MPPKKDPGKPPTSRSGPSSPPPTTSTSSLSNMTSAWAVGAGAAGQPRKQRSFAEIMADQKENRNILEISLTKIQKVDSDGNISKHRNLTFDEIGAFLFDTLSLKISSADCLRFNYVTGRYDSREVMFKPGVDLTPYVGSFVFLEHEIVTKKQLSNITKVTFKNVPLNIPDEEIVNLCETYGKPVEYYVHYEKLSNLRNKGMTGGTRYMEVELFPGASLNNFYWMEGPLPGDTGCRVTVLHPGQVQQCSNCLKLATTGCPGKGNGKACEALKTPRTTMTNYLELLRVKHGYRSLKQRYFDRFPSVGGAGNFGIGDLVERNDLSGDDDILPINPLEEKDKHIASLEKALEECKKQVSDSNALKDSLVKTKNEVKILRRSSSLSRNKLEFARKVTEQRMSNCLHNPSPDLEEELVSLYAALVDEDKCLTESDEISPHEDFLKNVEEKIAQKGENTQEKERFVEVKNKILERVKTGKLERRSRRDSVSSVSSVGSGKRGSVDVLGGDSSRRKSELMSSIPIKK